MKGYTQIVGKIFLWDYQKKIVISDVDGTITKSDVRGHIMPRIGFDWAQKGVVELYNKVNDNGYAVIYLTARALGQASATRSYLEKLKQDDLHLPDGPIVMSPDGLIKSLSREIKRKPHEFKISCLNKIRRLFPSNVRPFYCGFGNRETDTISYREVGVPEENIFIINKAGDLS